MRALAVDPGYLKSALVEYDGATILEHGEFDNERLLAYLMYKADIGLRTADAASTPTTLVLEEVQMFASRGVGKEVFDSIFWSGRFVQAWTPHPWDRMIRSKVRAHMCGTMKSGDSEVRAALITKFGPYKENAIGKKSAKGPLYGITGHEWQALGLAVTWWEQHQAANAPAFT